MPTLPVFGSDSVSGVPISCVTVSHAGVGEFHFDVVLGEAHVLRERRELRIVLHDTPRDTDRRCSSRHFLSQSAANAVVLTMIATMVGTTSRENRAPGHESILTRRSP